MWIKWRNLPRVGVPRNWLPARGFGMFGEMDRRDALTQTGKG